MKPIVSVIMNCFNGEKYLHAALESVLSQTFTDWELVFWDNQSTDHSASIFNSFSEPRFRYFQSGAHTTLGEARNLAVSHAKGTWLAFLDCDDMWSPYKLDVQIRQANSADVDVGIIYGPVQLKVCATDSNKISKLRKYYRKLSVHPHNAKSIYEDLLNKNFIIFSSLMIRRDLYWQVGGINVLLRQNEDYELLLKASLLKKAICIDLVCATYRIHGSNLSHSQVELNYIENKSIFGLLPASALVKNALIRNASRHAIFKMTHGKLLEGVRMLMLHGSPMWVLDVGLKKVVEAKNSSMSK